MLKFLVFLYLVSCFFLPPMAMSHGYLFIGSIINLGFAFFAFLWSKEHNNLPFLKKYGALVWCSSIIISLISGTISKGVFLSVISGLSIFLFFSSEKNSRLFFRYYVNVIFLLSIGALATEILCFYYPLDRLHLFYLDFSVNRYEYDIYFPFDIVSPYWLDQTSHLNRHYLFFGEPGIAPAFMFPALCLVYNGVRNKIRIVKLVSIAMAMFTTMSTTFPFALFGGVCLYYYFSHTFTIKHYFLLAFLGVGAIYAFLYMPYFGLYAKLNSDIYGVNVEAREGMVAYWVKQIQFVVTIFFTFIISKQKTNMPAYKAVNSVIAVCAIANIIFFSHLHLIFLLMFDMLSGKYNVKTN